ncbi:MAG: 16S rRNA (uracil(1498)-N(3))-methyltransferase [Burkholderiaceae bacterium]|nr:16S rRNA (uracil(1498)-N(3))-methyltransferase [Burkholderiaceae bacterium]
MPPRLHVDNPLAAGAELALPDNASRHVQVLRLQPGAALTLFDGRGGEWTAEVLAIGRRSVEARVGTHAAIERELATPVTLALGMPANERMDGLIEKATELGAAEIQPLVCERSVLRLAGDRAERKTAHWRAIAVAACEQSGRNRVPRIAPVQPLRDWLAAQADSVSTRLLLSLADEVRGLREALAGAAAARPLLVLSGPEGGLSAAELAAARAAGFLPVTLGARVLRADTAPLALLAVVAALENPA